MQLIKISPRGYCHGVVSAIHLATYAAHNEALPKPIYILGMLIHNDLVTSELAKLGVITIDEPGKTRVELLDSIDSGTVIFTAHGVSDEVFKVANSKNLHIIDATCSDVKKTHFIIKDALSQNKNIIYIGKKNHPETESCLTIDNKIILVENVADVLALENIDGEIIITNQTTLSLYDIANIVESLLVKFPRAVFYDEICDATKIRQEAVIEQSKDADLLIVVGDKKSNNSNKLAEVAHESNGIPVALVSELIDLKKIPVDSYEKIAITSGASTPTSLTKQVVKYLENPKDRDALLIEKFQVLPKVKHD